MITKIKPQRINSYPIYSVDSLADLNKLKSRTSVGSIAIYNGKEFALDLQRNWITNASPNEIVINPKVRKISDYLYYAEYENYDYNYANEYMRTHFKSGGACSSARNGNFYGRNYDWYYSDEISCVVKVGARAGRHASIGVALNIDGLTTKTVNDINNEGYKIMPFLMADGINDAGVFCNINVVPTGDYEPTTGTNEGAQDLCTRMVVRTVLDYANSADDAISMLQNFNIYAASGASFSHESHFMIGDANKTYVVEFINNEMKVITDKNIMTNFYLYGWDGNTATASYRADDYDAETTTLTPHSNGVERYNILAAGIDDVNSIETMSDLMALVKYTKAYNENQNPFWYSELNEDYGEYGNFTINNVAADYDEVKGIMISLFENRSRDDEMTWQTVHSSAYDIEKRIMCITPQENTDDTIYFALGE